MVIFALLGVSLVMLTFALGIYYKTRKEVLR